MSLIFGITTFFSISFPSLPLTLTVFTKSSPNLPVGLSPGLIPEMIGKSSSEAYSISVSASVVLMPLDVKNRIFLSLSSRSASHGMNWSK